MKVLFAGRKPVAAKCLEFLASQASIEVVGVLTDNHLAVSPTSETAARLGLQVLGYDEALARIEAGTLAFDLCLSMLYWRKFKAPFMRQARLGAINFHPAPLPQYKGCGGYNLAILEGRGDWGVTSHYMDESIDTGDIIEVDNFPIDVDRETAQSLEKTCQGRLQAQFVRVFERVRQCDGRLPTTNNVGGRYVSRDEMERMKLVLPGDDVARKIRAFWFPPYDGAYLMVDGVRCTLVDQVILAALADPASSSLFTAPTALAEVWTPQK
jgi:methionyl-tRNA formyltransferase